ncbi:MAG TPA: hypothetical protein VHL09_05575, partial [Dehalococcoidia bacterium]|nr:hypothetical protein [Dehalococcoidia bacterium]
MPVPAIRPGTLRARWKRSKTQPRSAAGMPIPRSRTERTAQAPSGVTSRHARTSIGPLRAVLDGVLDQVVDHPAEADGVPGTDRRQVIGIHANGVAGGRLLKLLHGLADQRDEIGRLLLQLERLADLQAR